MKFTVASAVAAVAALSASSFAAPAQEVRRDVGPSGSLNSPAGGTLITGTQLGQGGIWVDYSIANINYGDTYAYTYGIAASLESLDGKTTYLLSNGEATNPTSGKIQAYLKTPKGACGDFRFVVTETQYYRGQVIDFRSAAPTIKIDCAVTP